MRSLLWQAGRAGAFMRRTEQLLEPAQSLTAAKDDLQLLHQDQRLEKIAEIPDPFRRLNGVLARLSAAVAPGEQASAGILRRVPQAPSANANRLAALGPVAATSFSPSNPLVENMRNYASANAIRSAPKPEPRPRLAAPVILPDLNEPADGRIAAHSLPAEQGNDLAFTSTRSVPSGPGQSPAAAAREWNERLKDAVMRRAFQTPVRVDGQEVSPAILHPVVAVTKALSAFPAAQPLERAPDPGATDRRPGEVPAFPVEKDIPNLEPEGNPQRRRPLEWPSIASSPGSMIEDAPRPASGLRRLAALATEPLNDPEPASLSKSSPPLAVAAGEEFERLLRREAERHGIDLEGALR